MTTTTKLTHRLRRMAAVTALAGLSLLIIPNAASAQQAYSPAEIERINREYQDSLQQLQQLKSVYSTLPQKTPAAVAPPPPVVEAAPAAEELPAKRKPRMIATPATVRTPVHAVQPVEPAPLPVPDEEVSQQAEARAQEILEERASPEPTPNYPVTWQAPAPAPIPSPEPAPAYVAPAPVMPAPAVVAVPESPAVVTPIPAVVAQPVPEEAVVKLEPPIPLPPAPEPKHKPSYKDLPASMRLAGKVGAAPLPAPEPEVIPEAPVQPLPEAKTEYVEEPSLDDAIAGLEVPAPKLPEAPATPPSFSHQPDAEPPLPPGVPRLSEKTAGVLNLIPAQGLSTKAKDTLHVRAPVTIDRMQASTVFPPEPELLPDVPEETAATVPTPETVVSPSHPIAERPNPQQTMDIASLPTKSAAAKISPAIEDNDPSIRQDLGLHISVKQKDMTSFENLKAAKDALYAGQSETAIALYKQVLAAEPENKQALFGLGTAYHVTGQPEQAREYYQKVIMLDQNYWPALNNLFILASEEAPADALRHLEGLQKVNPQFAPIPAQIGMIKLQQGDYDGAAKSLARAASLDPQNMRYRFDLALLLDHMGDRKTAGMLYQQLLKAASDGKELPEPPEQIHARLEELMKKEVMAQ